MNVTCERINETKKARVFQSKVGIVIPAYNEARHFQALLSACRMIEPAVVVVVDDSSTDGSMDVLRRLRQQFLPSLPLVLLSTPRNMGKQGAVRIGLQALRDWSLDAVALMDGDGQHDPAQLPSLALLSGEYDVVIGARKHDEMPRHRRFSNWLVNTAYRMLGGVNFYDVQSGLRIYRKPLADELSEKLSKEGAYGLEHESLTLVAEYARKNGSKIRIAAADVSCAYGDSESKMRTRHILNLAQQTIEQAIRFRWASAC